jgi:hypothetical protein
MAFNFNNITEAVQNATSSAVQKGLNKVIPGDGFISKLPKDILAQ